MRKDFIYSTDMHHISRMLKIIREQLKKGCGESKKARKDIFKLFFSQHDVFSISTPLLFSDSNQEESKSLAANIDFVDRIPQLKSDVINYQFAYLVNVIACEPIGINYIGQKKTLLRDVIWPIVRERKVLEKLGIAIFQKFSLKKRFCIQMMKFGIVDWLLSILVDIKPQQQQYEL